MKDANGTFRWVSWDDRDASPVGQVGDGADGSLEWVGRWAETNDQFAGTIDAGGVWYNAAGPPHGSQYTLTGEGGWLLLFEGSHIRVMGTVVSRTVQEARNGNAPNKRWICRADSNEYPASDVPDSGGPVNGWPLCDIALSSSTGGWKRFQLVTRSTVADSACPVHIDRVLYYPNEDAAARHPTVLIEHSDPVVRLLPADAWALYQNATALTAQPHARAQVMFTGTQARWMGWLVGQYSPDAATASYTVDGAGNTTFEIFSPTDRSTGQPATVPNFLFFETPLLEHGDHQLEVVYHSGGAPLVLEHLEVESGDIHRPAEGAVDWTQWKVTYAAAPSGSPGVTAGSDEAENADASGAPAKRIVGGNFGGVAPLLLLLLTLSVLFRL